VALVLLGVALFVADLLFGSINISFSDVYKTITGTQTDNIIYEILLNYRLPKAITAVLAGAALSVSGLMLQTLFRNPLADPFILGVSSGASLGVAIVVLAAASLPFAAVTGGWLLVVAGAAGAALVLALVVAVSFRVRDVVSLLVVGIMFGTISAAFVAVLQNLSNPDTLKVFISWTFGSLSSVTWQYMAVLFPIILVGIIVAFLLQKRLDGLLLGENYARSIGIPVQQTRLLLVLSTGLLAGGITAFTGPIAFVGIAVPHFARGLFRTAAHRILLTASILCGAILLLICDIITQIPTFTLPINTVSSLFGAPVVIWILMKKRG
jgi:iron complex transport system permease protein